MHHINGIKYVRINLHIELRDKKKVLDFDRWHKNERMSKTYVNIKKNEGDNKLIMEEAYLVFSTFIIFFSPPPFNPFNLEHDMPSKYLLTPFTKFSQY